MLLDYIHVGGFKQQPSMQFNVGSSSNLACNSMWVQSSAWHAIQCGFKHQPGMQFNNEQQESIKKKRSNKKFHTLALFGL
jgi:hypothetical protein